MSSPAGPHALRLCAGTYQRNGGDGLHSLVRDSAGTWLPGPAYVDAANASFGAYADRYDLYYFVDEQAGAVNILRRREGWDRLARTGTMGEQPCYIAMSADQRWLAVANYGSGSISLWRLDPETGLAEGLPLVRQNEGTGPVRARQDGPHAHCVAFAPDRKWLYHVDLGTDEVLAHRLDDEAGWLGDPLRALAAQPGSGPRHLAFHPHVPLAVLASELASTVTLLEVGDGALVPRETLSTLPLDFRGESLAGHIAFNAAGDRVYVTNRGHDSVAVFALSDGALVSLQHVPSGGASPRAFILLEADRQLVLANEESGSLTSFEIAPDGTLSPSGQALPLPGAAFLLAESSPFR